MLKSNQFKYQGLRDSLGEYVTCHMVSPDTPGRCCIPCKLSCRTQLLKRRFHCSMLPSNPSSFPDRVHLDPVVQGFNSCDNLDSVFTFVLFVLVQKESF